MYSNLFPSKIDKSVDVVDTFYNSPSSKPAEGSIRTAFFQRELTKSPRDVVFEKLVKRGPANSNIENYNHWVQHLMEKQSVTKINVGPNRIAYIDNIRIVRPKLIPNGAPLFPTRARKSNLSYSGIMYGDLVVLDKEGKKLTTTEKTKSIYLGIIPVMLGSIACHLHGYTQEERNAVYEDSDDPLGYFIIKGTERLILSQENLALSQQISTVNNSTSCVQTSLTTQHMIGSTAIQISTSKTFPNIKIGISQSGLRGGDVKTYPLFAIFDILLTMFGYEGETFEYDVPTIEDYHNEKKKDPSREDDEILEELNQKMFDDRERIITKASEIIMFFVPNIYEAQVESFLTASRIKYGLIHNIVKYIIEKKIDGVNRNCIDPFHNAASINAKKSSSSFILSEKSRQRIQEKVQKKGEKMRKEGTFAVETDFPTGLTDLSFIPKPIAELEKEKGKKNVQPVVGDEDGKKEIIQELINEIFTGVPTKDKALHVGRLIAQHILVATGARPKDDRDAWENNRIKFPTDTISKIFNCSFKVRVDSLKSTEITRKQVQPHDDRTIWLTRQDSLGMLKRDTPIALEAQLGRLTSNAVRQSKAMGLRLIQKDQDGTCCPCETPTGGTCGLTKNMACTAIVTLKRHSDEYFYFILNKFVVNDGETFDDFVPKISLTRDTLFPHPVIVDNIIIGWCKGEVLIIPLKKATKTHLDFYDMSIFFNVFDQSLEIYTTGTRPARPLFTVDEEFGDLTVYKIFDDDREKIKDATIEELIELGAVEYVSPAEKKFYHIAKYPELVPELVAKRKLEQQNSNEKITLLPLYSEVDPIAILGIAASLMPRPETCQGPRSVYQSNMIAQALGLYNDLYQERWDSTFKRIEVERPTFETRTASGVGLNRSPTGKMFIVAYHALANNAEDGIVFQRESLERLRTVYYSSMKIVVDSDRKEYLGFPGGKNINELEDPSGTTAIRKKNYSSIGDDGLPRLGAIIDRGDCICARYKVITQADGSKDEYRDISIFAGVGDDGVVDRVDVTKDPKGKFLVRIKVRQNRAVNDGDKLASRYSQKGTVCARRSNLVALKDIGGTNPDGSPMEEIEIEEETYNIYMRNARYAKDLPRVASGPNKGLIADVFINPLGFPSRMTAGKLYEMFLSKVALITGVREDGSAFVRTTSEKIQSGIQALESVGLDGDGKEEMVHANGRKVQERIFIAPCFYQMLKHTVSDKIQYRAEGAVSQKTLQPVGGRQLSGGIRFGEMERSALLAHSASDLARERLMLSTDAYKYNFCATCGNQATVKYDGRGKILSKWCPVCKNGDKVGVVETPFIHILVNRMLIGLGINPTLSGVRPSDRPSDI